MNFKKQNGVPGIAGRNLRENLRSINMTNPSDMRKQTGDYSQPGFRGQTPRIELHSMGNENPAGGVGTGNPQTGGYQSRWQDQMNAIMDQILNRKEFSYDLNGDALYQQYKDQHMLQGQQAMMDTMGQAAALTGGYGNSWAQTAGQQAYQGHLQQLGNRIPELYNLALSKYQAEGQNLTDRISMMGAMDDRDYGRYQDDRNWDYQKERDALEDSRYDAEWEYRKERDQIGDDQWQREFDEAKRQYDLNYSRKGGSSGNSGTDPFAGKDLRSLLIAAGDKKTALALAEEMAKWGYAEEAYALYQELYDQMVNSGGGASGTERRPSRNFDRIILT